MNIDEGIETYNENCWPIISVGVICFGSRRYHIFTFSQYNVKILLKKIKINRQKNWPIGFWVGFASLLSHMDGKHFSFDVMKNVLTKVKLKEKQTRGRGPKHLETRSHLFSQ